jgi:plasmid maintenance system antidote protein VapI
VLANRVSKIVAGKQNITADTALRLGKWFEASTSFWLNLQNNYELKLAQGKIGKNIASTPTRAMGKALAHPRA